MNLAEALEQPANITLSDFLENISYVSLGTTPECLIDLSLQIVVTKDYILSITTKRCLQFNRKDGAFIREIGKYGRGPGEYQSTFGFFFNEQTSTCYFKNWNGSFAKYTLDGVFRGNTKIPLYDNSIRSSSFPEVFSYLNDTTFVCNFTIFDGTETNSLMVFNDKGKIVKLYPNKYILKKKQPRVIVSRDIQFHRFDNNLFFLNMYNDTVFQVDETRLIPSLILNRGKYCPTIESRWWPVEKQQKSNFIYMTRFFEHKRFIYFTFFRNKVSYFALYDKLMKTLKVSESKQGIKNTIDGFMDLRFNSINDSGELFCIIQPIDLLKWVQENPDKFKKLKPELQKLKEVKLEDNPIVVIATYKR